MSKKSKLVKHQKEQLKSQTSTKLKNRCPLCGRPRGYMGEFNMCRICFRQLAREGLIPGVKKSSW